MTTRQGADEELLRCSFCGKSQFEVVLLIAGPNAFICDECTDICCEILLTSTPESSALLQRARTLLAAGAGHEIDLSDLGIVPRFNRVKFRQRRDYVFYLGPFSEPFTTIYHDHVLPTVTGLGFKIDRADQIYGTQPIIEDIWEAINSSQIVLADITGRNPNVMYEIGMAHTVGKPVVILTQSIDDVPFDLRHQRCIEYAFTPRGCEGLQRQIEGTLKFLRAPK